MKYELLKRKEHYSEIWEYAIINDKCVLLCLFERDFLTRSRGTFKLIDPMFPYFFFESRPKYNSLGNLNLNPEITNLRNAIEEAIKNQFPEVLL